MHRFKGNAGTVWDTQPVDSAGLPWDKSEEPQPLTVMVCGHADKIRMQVRVRSDCRGLQHKLYQIL